MAGSRFVYVIYIRTSCAVLWKALRDPKITPSYWFGSRMESEWGHGAEWYMYASNTRLSDSGIVLEIVPPTRLVLTWRSELFDSVRAEGYSQVSFDLAQEGEVVKLTVTHESPVENSKLISGLSTGWPLILCSLKSLLETGNSFAGTRQWPKHI